MVISQTHLLMKKILFILSTVFISSFTAFSQENNPLINSGEVIKEGIKLHDEGKFSEAIAKFKLVVQSDTNYFWALQELSGSYNYNKEYDKAIETAKKGLAETGYYRPDFYTALANAYDDSGDSLKALEVYLQAIKEYPLVNLLYFNAGLTYSKLKKYDLAVEYYQKGLNINLFHTSSHLALGNLMARQGHVTPAILSLSMFILLEGSSDRAFTALELLEKIAKGTYTPKEPITTSYNAEAFKELDLIINSKIALNPKYKAKIKNDFDVVKQLQIMLEKFEFNKNETDFWMQTYGPFFEKVFKENKTEVFLYNILQPTNLKDVHKWLKSNKDDNTEFGKWAVNIFDKQRERRTATLDDVTKEYNFQYYSDGRIYGYGTTEKDINVGFWKYFNANGTLLSEINFNKEGKKEGTCKWYHQNGIISNIGEFKNGQVNGLMQYFSEKGILTETSNFKADSLEGTYTTYYQTGQKRKEGTYINNKKEGLETEFYKNGKIKHKETFKANKGEGEATNYYENGQLEWKCGKKDDKFDGPFETYFLNGKLKTKGQYKDDVLIGKWEGYYANGKLQEIKTLSDKGLVIGEYKSYYENGNIEEEFTSTPDGKINGPRKKYLESGKLYTMSMYENDVEKSIQFTDNKGKATDIKLPKSKFKFTGLNPNGTIKSEGFFDKGNRIGEWKFYNEFGKLSGIYNYVKDKTDGPYKTFYENGKVKSEGTYKEDQLHGYFKSYFRNGKLSQEGWYQYGLAQGTWITYSVNGNLKEKEYYINDNATGYNESYTVTGKLDCIYIKDYDLVERITYFDSTGKILSDDKLIKGNGTHKALFANGNTYCTGTYKNSLLEGEYTWYYANGKLDSKCNFVAGKREGTTVSFYENGNKKVEGKYKNSLQVGTWKNYYENLPNKIQKITSYDDFGDTDSLLTWFYENGKPEVISNYAHDKRKGVAKYFTETGETRIEKTLNDEEVQKFAYYKVNNEKVEAEIGIGQQKITAYFPNGKISAEEDILDGQLHGKRVYYYPNGQIAIIRIFEYGDQEGEETNYYSDGKVKSIEPHLTDYMNGICKYYRPDGKLEKEIPYVLGEKHGTAKFYDATGKLTKTVIYVFDQPMSVK